MLITISRQYGAGGSEVALQVADALGWRLVDNELVERVAARAGLAPEDVAKWEERVSTFVERLARTLAAATPEMAIPPQSGGTVPKLEEADLVRITESVVAEIAAEGRVVLVGRAAPAVLAQQAEALHVKLIAPKPLRVERVAERLRVSRADAAAAVDESDTTRGRYHRQYYRRDWNDPVNYHLVVNTGALGLEGATSVIVAEAERRGWASTRS
jgi:cytidylate kinase